VNWDADAGGPAWCTPDRAWMRRLHGTADSSAYTVEGLVPDPGRTTVACRVRTPFPLCMMPHRLGWLALQPLQAPERDMEMRATWLKPEEDPVAVLALLGHVNHY